MFRMKTETDYRCHGRSEWKWNYIVNDNNELPTTPGHRIRRSEDVLSLFWKLEKKFFVFYVLCPGENKIISISNDKYFVYV